MLLLSACDWKSEQWALHVEYTALCWLGEREGEEESAIDCQANTSQPLSPSFSIVSEH